MKTQLAYPAPTQLVMAVEAVASTSIDCEKRKENLVAPHRVRNDGRMLKVFCARVVLRGSARLTPQTNQPTCHFPFAMPLAKRH